MDIQDYFEYIIKKHETIKDLSSSVRIYPNRTNNRVIFKIKSGYKLELLSKETMSLLGSSSNTIDVDKDGEKAPKLESVEVVLVHCNLVNNSYQQSSKVLFTFVTDKKHGQLMITSPHSLMMLMFLGDKYGKKLRDSAIKTSEEFAKTVGKKVIHKSAEATGDLVGSKIADKITKLKSKKEKDYDKVMEEMQELMIPPEKRRQIIKDLKLF